MIVIQESDKFLHDECGICNLGNFPLWNTGHWALKLMCNPTEGIWNSGIQVLPTKNLESNNLNIKPTAWNPESKTDLDYIT